MLLHGNALRGALRLCRLGHNGHRAHRWHDRTSQPPGARSSSPVNRFKRSSTEAHGRATAYRVHATPQPAWTTCIAEAPSFQDAVDQAVAGAMAATGACNAPELALVFVSSAFVRHYGEVVDAVRQRVPSVRTILGSTGFGVIGHSGSGPREVESEPAISITLASLPNTELALCHVSPDNLPDGDAPPASWQQLLGAPLAGSSNVNFVVLAEPTFVRLEELLAGLDFAYPEANVLGGLSSAGMLSEARAMFGWQQGGGLSGMYRTGALVLAMHGDVALELLVAQGCRPLSRTAWQVEQTAPSSSNRIVALSRLGQRAAVPPVMALQEEFNQIKVESKQELNGLLRNMTAGLAPASLLGRAPEPQDFLIRQIGFDNGGNLVVGDAVRPGQQLKFMVRDRQGAMEDLESHGVAFKRRQLAALMSSADESAAAATSATPFGMLLFTCNGRGTGLYQQPDYDSSTISRYVPVPSSGFFCNGEIGKVGGSTRLHGFTCAIGVLKLAPRVKQAAAAADGGQAAERASNSEAGSSSEGST